MIDRETIRVDGDLIAQLETMAVNIAKCGGVPCQITSNNGHFFTITLNGGRSEFWERARFSSVADAIWYLRGVADGLQAVGQWQR